MRHLTMMTVAALAAAMLTPAFAVQTSPCSEARDSRSVEMVHRNVGALSHDLRQSIRGLESMALSPHLYQQLSHSAELARAKNLINRISAEVCALSNAAGSTSPQVVRFAAAARRLAENGNSAIQVINDTPNSAALLARTDYTNNLAAMREALQEIVSVTRPRGAQDMVAADD